MRTHTKERRPALLSTRQAADLLGLSVPTVSEMCKTGRLRAVRLGERGRWRVPRVWVDELMGTEPTVNSAGVSGEVLGAAMRNTGGDAA